MYKNILHLTDLTTQHYLMCEKAMKIAQQFQAQLHLLHVIELPPTLQLAQGLGCAEFDSPISIKDDAVTVMKTLGEALNIPESQQYVEIGSVQTEALRLIQSLDCEMLIIGHNVAHYLPTFLDRNVQNVAQQSQCDVLTIMC